MTAVAPDDACCPRCGYSQRGEIEAWTESCPLTGTCAECGLDLAWPELFRPDLYEPRWCVEYAPRKPLRPLPPLRQTFQRSLWPWWFWRSMKMSHALRRGRLTLLALAMLVVLAASYAVEQAAVAWRVQHDINRRVVTQHQRLQPLLQQQLADLRQAQREAAAQSDERSRAVANQLQMQIAQAQMMLNAPAPRSAAYLPLIRDAVLTPWSPIPPGVATPWVRAPAPLELHRIAFGDGRMRIGGGRRSSREVQFALMGTAATISLLILTPLGFVLLPVSRRRARVRWAHIVRVTVYSFMVPALLVTTALLLVAAAVGVAGDARARTAGFALLLATYLPAPYVALFWVAAIRGYLKMPHGWVIVAMLTVMNLMAVLGAIWLLRPDLAMHVYDLLVS